MRLTLITWAVYLFPKHTLFLFQIFAPRLLTPLHLRLRPSLHLFIFSCHLPIFNIPVIISYINLNTHLETDLFITLIIILSIY